MRRLNLAMLLLVFLVPTALGACGSLGKPVGEIGSIVTVTGTVTSIDTSEMAVDGPARIVLDTDQYGDVYVLVASCLGPCVLDVVERLGSVELGDRWQATGEVEGERSLVIYDQQEHSFMPRNEQ